MAIPTSVLPVDGVVRGASFAALFSHEPLHALTGLGECMPYVLWFEPLKIDWIPTLLVHWGYRPEDVRDPVAWWTAMTHPEERDLVTVALAEAMEGKRNAWDVQYRIRRADGTWAHVHVRARLVRDADGRPIGTEGVARDVSAAHVSTEALRESERLHRLLAENSREIICLHDPDGTYRYVSPAIREIAGWEPQELMGCNPYEFFHPEDRARIADEAHAPLLQQTLQRTGVVYRFRCRDGRYLWLESLTSPVRDENGHVVALQTSSRDVTEKRRLQERLQQVEKLETIGTLASGVAHDFNNLLLVMEANLTALREDLAAPDAPALLAEVADAVARAQGITRQLMLLGRQQLPEGSLCDPAHSLHALRPLLARAVGERIELTITADEDCWITWDRTQCEQVMLNLVGNAKDAMPDGGRITVSCRRVTLAEGQTSDLGQVPPGTWVRVAVEDTGTGMTPDILTRVLEPFFTTKERGAGTGLGLATVQSLIHRAGGHLTIDSCVGRGTTVACWLRPALAPR